MTLRRQNSTHENQEFKEFRTQSQFKNLNIVVFFMYLGNLFNFLILFLNTVSWIDTMFAVTGYIFFNFITMHQNKFNQTTFLSQTFFE